MSDEKTRPELVADNRRVERSDYEKQRIEAKLKFNMLRSVILALPPDEIEINSLLDRERIVEEAAALPWSYDPEVVKLLCSHFIHLSKYDGTFWKKAIKEARELVKEAERQGAKKQERTPDGKYEEYVDFFNNVLVNPKRDIFTEALMTKDRGVWVPAIDELDYLTSEAATLEQEGIITFRPGLIRAHLRKFERTMEPELLVDLPAWDRRDRIREVSSSVRLVEVGLSSEHFEELLKDWFAKAFLRLHNPKIQNRILILKGPQGVGKDTLVSALVDGLGQFALNLSILNGDKDSYLQLHQGLVLKIAEFDKTARTEVSIIKDMVTKENTTLRAPYDHKPRFRECRCSFIATCNVDDILRDHTGNRRFLIFEVENIDWNYSRTPEDSLQILAQAIELAAVGFRASPEAEEAMAAYVKEHTPQPPAEEAVELWEQFISHFIEAGGLQKHLGLSDLAFEDRRSWIEREGWISVGDAEPVFRKLSAHLQYSMRKLQQMFKLQKMAVYKRYADESPQDKTRGYLISRSGAVKSRSDDVSEIVF